MGWWYRLLNWLRGKKGAPPRSVAPGAAAFRARRTKAPPQTLLARLERATDRQQDDQMVRIAFESVRRGHPEQAEVAYERAAQLYRAHGLHRKAIAVLWALVRFRPDDPFPFLMLGEAYEGAERWADAARAFATAARLYEDAGQSEEARTAQNRARTAYDRPGIAVPGVVPEAEAASGSLEAPPSREPEPTASEDLPEEEVRSLVLEGLNLGTGGATGDPVPVARVQPVKMGVPSRDPEAIELDLGSEEDPDGMPGDAAPLWPSEMSDAEQAASRVPVVGEFAPAASRPASWGAAGSADIPGSGEERIPLPGSVHPPSDEDAFDAPTDDRIWSETGSEALEEATDDSLGLRGDATMALSPVSVPAAAEATSDDLQAASPSFELSPGMNPSSRRPDLARDGAWEPELPDGDLDEPDESFETMVGAQDDGMATLAMAPVSPESHRSPPSPVRSKLGTLQDAATTYDPEGSAAVQAARRRLGRVTHDASTSVGSDEQVRELLHKLRASRDED